MINLRPVVDGLAQPVSLCISPQGSVLVLQRDGGLIEVDVSSCEARSVGTVHSGARKLDLIDGGQTALIVGGQPGLWRYTLGSSEPAEAVVQESVLSALHVNADTGIVFTAEASFGGQLLAISLNPYDATPWADSLRAPRALLSQQDSGQVLLAEAAQGGTVSAVAKGNRKRMIASGLGAPVDMDWLDSDQTQLLIADAVAGRILHLDLSQPTTAPRVLYTGLVDLYAVKVLNPNELIVGAGNGVWVGELSPVTVSPVEFEFPSELLFVAGWMRVPVIIHDPSINFDDLDFYIKPEEAAAMVSLSRDNGFDPAHPEIVVTAGWMAGEHRLIGINRPTGDVVAEATFEVTDTWLDDEKGPSLAVLGAIESGPTAGTWGGGDFTTPQNNAIVPARGVRNVAVVLVDTNDALYPTGAALTTIINGFRDEMVNGVMVNGQNRSVAGYFDQASNGDFTLNIVDIVGTISLPNGWGTYFNGTPKDDNGDGTTDWTQWSFNNTFVATVIANIVQRNEAAAAAGNPAFLDLSRVDSLIITVRSVPATATMQSRLAWPRANLGPNTHIIGWMNLGLFRLPLFRSIAAVVMPDDWATPPQSGRRWHETVSHELGHNLQLNDQYFQRGVHDATVRQRIADNNPNNSWELMSWEENLPLPSAAHRLMLGWLDPAEVKLFNFGVFGPVDERVTLHAASDPNPTPTGRFRVAEVRIADGRNYYFEYRPVVAGRMVDANPPAGVTVFASDVTSRGNTPSTRPEILRLRDDADADRSEFQAGDDYEEVDTTSPQFPNDFVVDVVSTTADSATLRFRYGLDQEPDPAITPWSAGTNWQSPDIEVRNARSMADPTFRNVPWEGHDNTVIARVTNRGQIPATGVRVRFGAKDFTFAGGAESSLGDQTQDVATGATVTFTAPTLWRPVQLWIPFFQLRYLQHACLVARIDPYINGAIVEVTPDNNEAQSNYTWVATTTASPASREVAVINAHNPLSAPAYVSFEVWQPHPLFRVYLSHRWVRLDPGASAPILVMVESLLGDPMFEPLVKEFQGQERRIMTTLRLSALGDTGEACAPSVLGGVSILTITGRATRFDKFEANVDMARGVIVTADTGQGVDGPVLVSIRGKNENGEQSEVVQETFASNGVFETRLRFPDNFRNEIIVQGHYLGDFRFTPCDSEELQF